MEKYLLDKVRNLPTSSGVYLMNNHKGEIIYVGKARNLKNRVRSYFGSSKNMTEKVIQLMQNVEDFRYIITNNEVDALVLENNLIKKYTPKYNILLKDDKQYPFLKLDTTKPYPKLEVVRVIKKDKARYFGPYMQGINVKDIMSLVEGLYPLRTCNLNFSKIPKSHRPCLNYHLGLCKAPCEKKISKAEYNKIVKDLIMFLKGNDLSAKKILQEKMECYASNQQFETAISYREKLKVLEKVTRKQITYLPKDFNLDVFAVSSNMLYATVSYIVIRGGKLVGEKDYPIQADVNNESTLSSFIMQFYEMHPLVCDEIIVSLKFEDNAVLEEYFKEKVQKKINIITPVHGIRKQLVNMAEKNARDYLFHQEVKIQHHHDRTVGALEELQKLLGLEMFPAKIECYDISNISGTDKVSSMVVNVMGELKNSYYRRFKIRNIEGANDFECMKQTLIRRLEKSKIEGDASFSSLPSLIVVDGGKGQLKYGLEALKHCNLSIPIIGLAKRDEEIFVPNQTYPIVIPKSSPALHLLQRLRDEAHRFAITYNKKLRISRQTASILNQIEGIGPKKAHALMDYFKNINKIKNASEIELLKVYGIGKNDCKNIIKFFSKKG